jgi:hypothetical protein
MLDSIDSPHGDQVDLKPDAKAKSIAAPPRIDTDGISVVAHRRSVGTEAGVPGSDPGPSQLSVGPHLVIRSTRLMACVVRRLAEKRSYVRP